MENSEIRLLLLDFDGTLADTRRANTLAYVAASARRATRSPRRSTPPITSECGATSFSHASESPTPPNASGCGFARSRSTPRFSTPCGSTNPYGRSAGSSARSGGRVWVVSTGSRANIDNVMRHLGIGGPAAEVGVSETGLFRRRTPHAAGRVDGKQPDIGDVERPKPAPDCFLEAMRREGCTPRETLIFEDSQSASRRHAAAERPISW